MTAVESAGRLGTAGPVAVAGRFWSSHPERTIAGVALAGWALLAAGAGHSHAYPSWLRLQAGWVLMVAAMMLPPALPMARHVIQNSKRYRGQRAGLLFAGASLLLWLGIGPAAASPAVYAVAAEHRRWLLGGALLLAALWELTPAKRRALKACHRTIPLPPDGRKANRACVEQGLRYGSACFQACWALMLPMALAGHGGLFLMAMLTAIAVVEEVVRKGYRLVPLAAVLLTVAGLMVLVLG